MTAEKEKLPDAGLTLAYLTSNLTPHRPLPLPSSSKNQETNPEKGEIAKLKLYLPI